MSGIKHDQEKLRVDLLDPYALEGTAGVLTHGAAKYGDRNWEGGIKWSRVLGAILRHLLAIMRGEDLDRDSGLLHVDHLACEAMFLQRFYRTHQNWDDRPTPQATAKQLSNSSGSAQPAKGGGVLGTLLGALDAGVYPPTGGSSAMPSCQYRVPEKSK